MSDWPHYDQPACPRCHALARGEAIQVEAVMPLPPAGPLARDGSGKCCHDCAAADSLSAIMPGMEFSALRLCTANERIEDLRRPIHMRAAFGLFKQGLMRPHTAPLAFRRHHRWLALYVPEWKLRTSTDE